MTQAEPAAINPVVFSKETYGLISSFSCGDSQSARLCEDWIKGVPPDPCAFQSIEKHRNSVWIYSYQNSAVGYGSLGVSKANGKKVSFIPMLAVHADYQGKDIDGKRVSNFILNHLIESARGRGLDRVCLYVQKENIKAISLYERFGFGFYGEELAHGNRRMCKCISDGDALQSSEG